jgi:hypothetical protein
MNYVIVFVSKVIGTHFGFKKRQDKYGRIRGDKIKSKLLKYKCFTLRNHYQKGLFYERFWSIKRAFMILVTV